MNINNKFVLCLCILMLGISGKAKADEGMWMINAIDAALEKKMAERGLQLSAREIYNADAPGSSLSDAVVSMEFGCTGSIISDQGLLITNHHCAYSDVHALSTPEHNYLEEGFWAFRSEEEMNITGKSVYFLKRVLDVTDEVLKLQADLIAEGKPSGSRRLSHLMEQKYSRETGLEAMLSSMWRGSKYYLALYEVMEKDNPDIFDYNIPQTLRDIYATKDYGRWADSSGEVPVCFIATNHTTGGNSGSPVINADGDLIGLNFDRVWEGTMSDIVFDPEICRNISLDVRYVLFTIEKIGGAGYLIDEMTLIE